MPYYLAKLPNGSRKQFYAKTTDLAVKLCEQNKWKYIQCTADDDLAPAGHPALQEERLDVGQALRDGWSTVKSAAQRVHQHSKTVRKQQDEEHSPEKIERVDRATFRNYGRYIIAFPFLYLLVLALFASGRGIVTTGHPGIMSTALMLFGAIGLFVLSLTLFVYVVRYFQNLGEVLVEIRDTCEALHRDLNQQQPSDPPREKPAPDRRADA